MTHYVKSDFKFGEIYPPRVNMVSKFLTKSKQKKTLDYGHGNGNQ